MEFERRLDEWKLWLIKPDRINKTEYGFTALGTLSHYY
jgi:hypothetical protein